jgi:polyisoprenoid-binding protein YceI
MAATVTTPKRTSTWNLDPTHTLVEFSAKHMVFATVKGRFDRATASIVLDEGNLDASSVSATIESASLNSGVEQRDAHLKGADFLDVENYPSISFVSRGVESSSADRARILGDLTIRDVTRPVTLDTTFEGRGTNPWGQEIASFHATARINRRDFGLTWNVALDQGGVLVGEEIRLAISAEAIRQP